MKAIKFPNSNIPLFDLGTSLYRTCLKSPMLLFGKRVKQLSC